MALVQMIRIRSLKRYWTVWTGSACCLCAFSLGCASTQENLANNSKTSENYPIDSPAAKKAGAKVGPQVYLSYAKVLEQNGKSAEARKNYEQVLADNPKSVEAIIGLARLDQLAGRTVEAEKGFLNAVKLEPKSPKALDAMGQFYADQSKWEQSLQFFNLAMQAAPENKTYRYHLGLTLAKAGQHQQAVQQLTLAGNAAEANYNVGLILHDKGDLRTSEGYFTQAVTLNPYLSSAQYWLDEVRKEQETQTVIANSTRGPNAQNVSASRGYQATPTAGSSAGLSPSVSSAQYSRAPANPRITSGAGQSTPWPAPPNAQQNPQGGNWNQQQAGVPQQRPAIAQPAAPLAAPPPGVSAQQWEQWNNQKSAGVTQNVGLPGQRGNSLN